MRPGLLVAWDTTLSAFETSSYGNRIGVTARADRIDDLVASLADRRMTVRAWYGVRVFTDITATNAALSGEPELTALPGESALTALPGEPELTALPACEERADATDPYRRVAALTHVFADRA